MSKPSKRPTREARKLLKTKIIKAQREIRNRVLTYKRHKSLTEIS